MAFLSFDGRSRAVSIETAAPAARADFSTDALATRDLPTVTDAQRGAKYAAVTPRAKQHERVKEAARAKREENETKLKELIAPYEKARDDLLKRINAQFASITRKQINKALAAARTSGKEPATLDVTEHLFKGTKGQFEALAPTTVLLPHLGFGLPEGSPYAVFLNPQEISEALLSMRPITFESIQQLPGYKTFLSKLNEKNEEDDGYTVGNAFVLMSTPGDTRNVERKKGKQEWGYWSIRITISSTPPEASR